jgi:hypothetical protein
MRKASPLPSLVYLAGVTLANFSSFHFLGISKAVIFCLPGLLLASDPFGLLTFLPFSSRPMGPARERIGSLLFGKYNFHHAYK